MMRMLPHDNALAVLFDLVILFDLCTCSFICFHLSYGLLELGFAKSATLFTPDRNENGPLLCKGQEMF